MFVILSLVSLICFGIFWGWLAISLAPAFEGTGITFSDLFKKNLDPEKYKKLEDNLTAHSETLGKESAQKLIGFLEKLFPNPEFDYSKVPAVEYPYGSVDDVMDIIDDASQEGFDKGLDELNKVAN